MKLKSRRAFLKSSLLGGILGYGVAARADYLPSLTPTPSEIKGPFYPITPQKDKDFDLTKVEGREGTAKGEVVWIEGNVQDTSGNFIEDATVDLWQANAAGRYAHPHDSNTAPVDPNFQGWAIVPSGKKGSFRFKTIVPGSYPAADDWDRPRIYILKLVSEAMLSLLPKCTFPINL